MPDSEGPRGRIIAGGDRADEPGAARRPYRRGTLWLLAGALFAILATANAAGYRYGVSDQAFYVPVVARALDPAAFPRDAPLIDAQGRLMAADEVLAAVAASTGLSIETLFFGGYLLSLAIIWSGLALVGHCVYRSPWLTVALGAAFTLRHRIPRTSANSFEPYFHPRMFAFGIGVMAIAAVLRRRTWAAVALIAIAATVHITTALWFAVLVGTALVILDNRMRRLALAAALAAVTIGAWALAAGPMRSSLTQMDDVWLQAVATKDSLFPSQWPLWAWAANLGMLGALWWAHLVRTRGRRARAEDAALVWGTTALVGLFLVTLPLVTLGLALPVQLQISRVFWLVDFVALVYVLALVEERKASAGRAAAIVAALLVTCSVARGVYVMRIERPERALFAIHLPDSPWEDAMRWLARQPDAAHILADPGHAWKHGTSVRVSARRDVFLEEVKDSAIAIYSREVALRVVERTNAIGDFAALTAERAHELARTYGLDYLVTEADLPLPVLHRNSQFTVYDIEP